MPQSESSPHAQTPLKWRARVVLHRLGIWDTLEMGRMLMNYLLKIPHEEDFRFFSQFNGQPGLFLDIGANRGQSALSFRIFNKTSRIISFEPNRDLERDLKLVTKVLGESVEYRMFGLGKTSRELTMYTPKIEGVLLSQETTSDPSILLKHPASLERYQTLSGGMPQEIVENQLQIRPLDSLELNPTFIKIDAQGAELEILEGATKTLQRSHPVLMIENSLEVDQWKNFLSPLGYEPFRRNSQSGELEPCAANSAALNLFFIPKKLG